MITITAYNWVPDLAKGRVRDLRARWALEEAGLPYTVKLIDHQEKLTPEYRKWQVFSQVPAYDDGEVKLFESGAIVLHIAERSNALMPTDPAGRARTMMWVIAALNSLEPFFLWLVNVDVFQAGNAWTKEARPSAEAMVKKRLGDLGERLKTREWLEDRFTAGDLMMAEALRMLDHTDLVKADPVLGPYLERCLARPAFKRAMEAQLADFTGEPGGL